MDNCGRMQRIVAWDYETEFRTLGEMQVLMRGKA